MHIAVSSYSTHYNQTSMHVSYFIIFFSFLAWTFSLFVKDSNNLVVKYSTSRIKTEFLW